MRAFGFVGGAAEVAEADCLAEQSKIERQVDALIDGAQGFGDGERCVGGNFESQGLGARHQFGGGKDFINETDAEGLTRVDDGAGEQQFESRAAAHEAWQALRAAVAGHDAQLDLRLAEAGIVSGQAQGAGHGQLAASAQRKALDAGDDRLAEGLNAAKDLLPAKSKDAALFCGKRGQLADVGAGNKSPATGASEKNYANCVIGGQLLEGFGELGEGFGVEGVEDFGPVEGDDGQRRAFVEVKICKFHARERVAEEGMRRLVEEGGALNAERQDGV